MKCNNCGETVSDGAKFCKFCGAKIEAAPTAECPSCGKSLDLNSKFCAYCGAKLKRETFVVCPNCGANDTEDSKFCGECGTDISAVERTNRLVIDGEAETHAQKVGGEETAVRPEKKSAAHTAVKIKEKAVDFENKTYLARNVLIAVLSLMFALFALLMPVKIVGYNTETMIITNGADDIEDLQSAIVSGEEIDDIEITCRSAAVSQHIWHIFGALRYVGVDVKNSVDDKKKVDEINKKIQKAVEEAQTEAFDKYAVRVPGSTNYTVPMSKLKAYNRAYERSLNKYLSRENYLGYLIANDCYSYYHEDAEVDDPGRYVNDLATLIIMLVVTAVAFAIAGMSIAWLIFAIIGITDKKRKVGIERLLAVVSILSTAGFVLTALAPFGKAGGGMAAVMLTAATACLLVGAMNIATGETKVSAFIKRIAVAVPMTICLLLLCANAVALKGEIELTVPSILGNKSVSMNIAAKMSVPVGAFLAEAIDTAVASALNVISEIDRTGIAISGFVSYGLTVVAVLALGLAVVGALLALLANKNPRRIPSIVAAVFVLALIIFTGGATKAITESYAYETKIEGFTVYFVEWFVMRAQAYFTMFISIGTFLASLLIREKKDPQNTEMSEEKSEEPVETKNETGTEETDKQPVENNNIA